LKLDQAREVLTRYWGHPDFRPGQDQAVRNVLSGGDSLTIMPTGGGKSLCFQVPAMLLPGVTLVVSPLISLMKDQVDTLQAAGVPATLVNSTLSQGEMAARMDAAERGEFRLLYVAPERFDADDFQRRLARLDVSLLAIDEAHCVSEWGHDFRPSYLRLGAVREALGDPPIAALTATATPEVRDDVIRQLRLRDPSVLVTGFDRRNLVWHVLRARGDSEKDRLLLRLLRGRDGSAVVYASTRRAVDALTLLLNGAGVRAVGYHAGLPDGDRKRIQEEFMSGRVPVVVATNAFGMGIDKGDVRIVVHYNLPGNLEAYYQEAGRAGRDGGPADCVLLHAYRDRFTHEYFITGAYPPRTAVEAALRALRGQAGPEGLFAGSLEALVDRAIGLEDARQAGAAVRVLEQHGLVRQSWIGGPQPIRVRLLARPERISRELAGQPERIAFLRRLWRASGGERLYDGVQLDGRVLDRAAGGRGTAAPLLDGLAATGFLEWSSPSGEGIWVLDRHTPLPRLPVDWRGLAERKRRELAKLQQMQGYAYAEGCRRGYVLRYFGDPAAMRACGACDNCLGAAPIAAVEPVAARRRERAPRPPGAPRASVRGVEGPEPGPEELELYGRLKELRSRLSREAGLPAYCVLTDRTLVELARRRPADRRSLLAVPGIGPGKLERYGDAFLALLAAG
jgi:ATP-dependent DNA helicase RecQ